MTPLAWAAVAIVLIGAAMGARAVYVALFALRVTRVDAHVDDLPDAFDGYTIAVVADLHHHPATGMRRARQTMELVRAAQPDLVALLGDYGVSWRKQHALNRMCYERMMDDVGPLLREVTAALPTVAVLGNHDHYTEIDVVQRWLTTSGARVLRNDSLRVERDGATLLIGGVGDAFEDVVDPSGGCAHQPADAPTVVLSHNPDAIGRLDRARRVDLVLAGHTHGGQVVLPFVGALTTHSRICTHRHPSGWVPNDRAPLFVSRGIGAQTPLRFNCMPELLFVRLRKGGCEP